MLKYRWRSKTASSKLIRAVARQWTIWFAKPTQLDRLSRFPVNKSAIRKFFVLFCKIFFFNFKNDSYCNCGSCGNIALATSSSSSSFTVLIAKAFGSGLVLLLLETVSCLFCYCYFWFLVFFFLYKVASFAIVIVNDEYDEIAFEILFGKKNKNLFFLVGFPNVANQLGSKRRGV